MTGRAELPKDPVLSRRRLLYSVSAMALAAPLAGCGLLGGSDEDSGDGGKKGKLEKAKLKIGQIPIVDIAPLMLAQKKGYFTDEGLTLELVPAPGGAELVPQMVGGDLDIVFTNWPTVFSAQAKGVAQFKIINAGYESGDNVLPILTLPSSGIKNPKDLEGKTVSVNTRDNIAELTARSAMRVARVDDTKVTFVEVAFPDVPDTLAAGEVHAAYSVEPFTTIALQKHGATILLDTAGGGGPTDGIPIAGYAATAEFAEANPNTVAAFQRALGKAQAEVADRLVVQDVLQSYIKNLDEKTTQLMNLGQWPTSISKTRLQRVADLMKEFEVITDDLDVGELMLKSSE